MVRNMSDLETFRTETRTWLEANCPPSMRGNEAVDDDDNSVWGGRKATFKNPEQKQWLDRMAAKGWTAPTWPTKYGGGGLSNEQALILEEEMHDLGCRVP